MKFLLDVGISPELGRLLEEDGHEVRRITDYYSPRTADEDILEIARQEDETVITHDLDFGTLLAFSSHNRPSVIIFRIHHINAKNFHRLIRQHWNDISEPLSIGAVVIIQSSGVRIRMLPLQS